MYATHTHARRSANCLLPLLLLVTALCALAGRNAQAQNLWLPRYAINVNLHYSTGKTNAGRMQVISQDSTGHFSGTLTVNGLPYTVTGTLTYWGTLSGSLYYSLSFDATYQQRLNFRLISTSTLHYGGWIQYMLAYDAFNIGANNFTWSNFVVFGDIFTSGSGTLDGYGFPPIK